MARKKRYRMRNHTRVNPARYQEKICEVCHEFFYSYIPQAKYCSSACGAKAWRDKRKKGA